MILLTSVFVLGLFFGLGSWDKNLYVQWNPFQERGVAGADSSPEILNLSSEQLTQQADQTLFSQGQAAIEGDMMFFYLGNLLISNSESNKHQFVCEFFSKAEFSFSAVGLSLSGEKGLMVIQSPCNMEEETLIGPFWIPYKEILNKPAKRSFELPEKETYIRFYNASTALTSSWLLTSVRFFNESQMEEEDQTEDEFLVRFTPGSEKSHFELNLKNPEPPQENPLPEHIE